MKKLFLLLIVLIPSVASAEFYKVEVTRLDKDLYRTSEGFYIETKYCYEYATRDTAVLSYEQYSYDNKLIFEGGDTCEVKRIFK